MDVAFITQAAWRLRSVVSAEIGIYTFCMDKTTPKKRGPKPIFPGEVMQQKLVTLDQMTIRKLKVLGGDNLSRGVREAAEVAYDRYQSRKD